ncbi:Uncharacterized protein TCM_027750 [Theobroma cacao]|uniref:Uncharacterized protein n=1 Tax=Theobroma cacao TaxID=3641 RepID=A0A061GA44_THECC|nr:Uncharacterized protein TCM_027750 [Theobroma cacao]
MSPLCRISHPHAGEVLLAVDLQVASRRRTPPCHRSTGGLAGSPLAQPINPSAFPLGTDRSSPCRQPSLVVRWISLTLFSPVIGKSHLSSLLAPSFRRFDQISHEALDLVLSKSPRLMFPREHWINAPYGAPIYALWGARKQCSLWSTHLCSPGSTRTVLPREHPQWVFP